MQESMLLWDAMFATDSSLGLAVWVGLAMLIRIRNNCESNPLMFGAPCLISTSVIPSSYNTQLSTLLHYPSLVSPDISPETNHIVLLVRQAAYLRDIPTVASGAAIVYENRNVLGIEVTVPAREPGHSTPGNLKPSGMNTPGLPDFAKGILDRGEQWGVNRTVLNTISGIRVRRILFKFYITKLVATA
jgi:TBC1 domain family member 5